MIDTLNIVREFHTKFNVPILASPHIDKATALLRIAMLIEELGELAKALSTGNLVESLDALVDSEYFLDGTYLELGFGDVRNLAFLEVHRSNMSKLDRHGKPIKREDGKILKGPDYFPPNLKQFIKV